VSALDVAAAQSGEGSQEKRVTWAELLFDLVFVFAVIQLSGLLHHDHAWAGVGRALVVFVPLFAGSYHVARLVLAFLVFRGRRATLNPFSVAVTVSGPLLLAGAFLHGPARLTLWAVAAAVDLATPRLLRGRLSGLRFDPAHLPERFGLFLIIALSESIVATGAPAASAARFGTGTAAAVGGAFVLVCALYLTTFGYTRWRMFRLWSVYRLSGAAVLLALLPAAPRVPALAALYAVAAVVIAVNVVEYILVRRRGNL
jgi:low temperature requirement protein LtrA